MTDLIGLGLERFDGLGGVRKTENGAVIDPSGMLDSAEFGDAIGLGQVIASHPDFLPCIVNTLWSFANGRVVGDDEGAQIAEIEAAFEASDHRILALLEAITMSDGFRRVGAVENEVAP